MPHKHTRKPGAGDESQFNLAPSTRAAPLPAFAKRNKDVQKKRGDRSKPAAPAPKPKRKGTKGYKEDDTPRAFARMMQFQAGGKRPDGLDDGRKAKKRKITQTTSETTTHVVPPPTAPAPELPKILPGERLADYSARVDQALPVGNLVRKGKVEGVKERQTKTEKRLKKMYASWREDDARLKEKADEAAELEEEEEDERKAKYGENYRVAESRNGKKRKVVGEADDDDGDPWAVLKEKRAEGEKSSGLRGLHDVVLAPPTLKVVPKEKFKVRNGAKVDVANVPAAAGSLRRREELSDARRDVIERYRAMMKGKSGE